MNWNPIFTTASLVLSFGLFSGCGKDEATPHAEPLQTGILAKLQYRGDQRLDLYNFQGHPLPRYTPVNHVQHVEVSQHRIAYLQGDTLYKDLHILNEQGDELVQHPEVDKVVVSDHAIAYRTRDHRRWYFLNESGAPLSVDGITDGEDRANIREVLISDAHIAFVQANNLHLRTITGEPLPGWDAITNVAREDILLSNTLVAYVSRASQGNSAALHVRNLSMSGGPGSLVVNDNWNNIESYKITDRLIAVEPVQDNLPVLFFNTQGQPIAGLPTIHTLDSTHLSNRFILYTENTVVDTIPFITQNAFDLQTGNTVTVTSIHAGAREDRSASARAALGDRPLSIVAMEPEWVSERLVLGYLTFGRSENGNLTSTQARLFDMLSGQMIDTPPFTILTNPEGEALPDSHEVLFKISK